MELIVSIAASLAVAAVFYVLGRNKGYENGYESAAQAYKEAIIPKKQENAVREAYERITPMLWCLRDDLHNLPFGWELPQEETSFIHSVLCCIPTGVESVMLKTLGGVETQIPREYSKYLDVLSERYIGEHSMVLKRPLEPSDFEMAEQGDYAAAVYIAMVILYKRTRDMNIIGDADK